MGQHGCWPGPGGVLSALRPWPVPSLPTLFSNMTFNQDIFSIPLPQTRGLVTPVFNDPTNFPPTAVQISICGRYKITGHRVYCVLPSRLTFDHRPVPLNPFSLLTLTSVRLLLLAFQNYKITSRNPSSSNVIIYLLRPASYPPPTPGAPSQQSHRRSKPAMRPMPSPARTPSPAQTSRRSRLPPQTPWCG